jgi:hypothetical protein
MVGKEYGKIRKSRKTINEKEAFSEVISNIKKMVKIREENNYQRPQLRTNTIYPPISKNPEEYRVFMEDIGIGLVTVNEMLDFRGAELPDDAVKDNWFCQYPFQRLVISANGTILPCPGSHNEEEELVLGKYVGTAEKRVLVNGKSGIVDNKEVTIKQAWELEKIEKIRRLHKENRRTDIWACKHCRHGAKKYGVTWVPQDWDMENMEWAGRAWRNG